MLEGVPMTLFAEYQPHQHGQRDDSASLRPAALRDVAGLARLCAERGDSKATEAKIRFERELSHPLLARGLWVAEQGDSLVAYARAVSIELPADAVHNHQPAGWYLGGVVVDAAWRRRGIGQRLTQVRLDYLASEGAREVFFTVNASNRASIDLHRPFGFQELTRDFSSPGAHFEGGIGILFRLDLMAPPGTPGPRTASDQKS
jgi:ribosomal protein S18 acetylase RimI-like enzyme